MAAADPSGLGSHPLWHLAAVGVTPVAIIVSLKVYDRFRHPVVSRHQTTRGPRSWPPAAQLVLAAGTALAGVIHVAVCPEHFREGIVLGVFFVILAAGQLTWAWLVLVRPSRRLLWLALLGSAGVIVVWVWTRTIGVPFASNGGGPESPGIIDVVATLLEFVVVVGSGRELGCRLPVRDGMNVPQ